MKSLLFDQNISPRLVALLADLYPDSAHVDSLGLSRATDKEVWEFARQHHYTIVSKDADFSEMGVVYGFPPKIVWIRRGNCSTKAIEAILRDNFEGICAFGDEAAIGILMLL